jgi:tRNA-specific 2-thiouridylase
MQSGDFLAVECRIRYRQPLFKAKVTTDGEHYFVLFDEQQFGVAKGQFAAFYKGEELIGSGPILD